MPPATFLLLSSLGVHFAFGVRPAMDEQDNIDSREGIEACSNPDCKKSAEWLRPFLDTKVNPCHDFSAFTCSQTKKVELLNDKGNIFKREYMGSQPVSKSVERTVIDEIFGSKKEPVPSKSAGDIAGEKLAPLVEAARTYFTKCNAQKSDTMSEDGCIKPAIRYLRSGNETSVEAAVAGSSVVHHSLQGSNSLGLLHINPFFAFLVMPDLEFPSRGDQLLLLLRPCPEVAESVVMSRTVSAAQKAIDLGLLDADMIPTSEASDIWSQYETWLANAAQGDTRSCKTILIDEAKKHKFSFAQNLTSYTSSEIQQHALDAAKTLKPFSKMTEFSLKVLDVPKLFGGPGWQQAYIVGDRTALGTWAKGYATFERGLKGVKPPAHPEKFSSFVRFSSFVMRVKKSLGMCKNTVSKMFDFLIGRIFAQRVLPPDARSKVAKMFEQLLITFNESSNSLSWISPATKQKALEKASAMKVVTGYPDWLLNDNDMLELYEDKLKVSSQDSFVELQLRKEAVDVARLMKIGHQPRDWVKDPFNPPQFYNLGYNPFGNIVNNYAAYMSPPNFVPSQPMSFSFGFLGMMMAHEVTHAFDAKGAERDASGDKNNWWSPASREKFEATKRCFVNQYSSFPLRGDNLKGDRVGFPETTAEPVHDDGTKCIAENIADSGGLNLAYLAYKQWAAKNGEEPRLEGLEQYTPEQLFFIRFGAGFCDIKDTKGLGAQISETDPHAVDRMRVIGAVQNSRAFARAFSCAANTPMNPTDKCELWGSE